MKKKIALFCAMIMIIMCCGQAVGAINVILNSSFIVFPDQQPVDENGVILVPIRTIAEKMGLEVGWDDPSDTVTLKKDKFFIEMVIGSTAAKTNAGVKTLEAAPKIINGRTMVPLEFVAKELGLTVSYNKEYWRVIINGKIETELVEVATEAVAAESASEGATEKATEAVEEETEPETEAIDENTYAMATSGSATITFVVPSALYAEDTELEDSFAYRSLDAFDVQHTYNWETVTQYESYADESRTNGVILIVQENAPYEGKEYDVNKAFEAMPERPESPSIDWNYLFMEAERLIIEQICVDKGIEMPDGYDEMEDAELAEALGFASAEELSEYIAGIGVWSVMEQIPEYNEYVIWQEADNEYRRESLEIQRARDYAKANFSTVYSQADDAAWAELFSQELNTDIEVRYDGVEIVDFNGKKLIHATIFAEDPDDEQGTYEYYQFLDGSYVVTVFGGSLYQSEASPDVVEILSSMVVE